MAPDGCRIARHPWSAARYPTMHAVCWAAGGCRSIRCNGGADWASSRRLAIPVLIGRDFFCRRFTFSKVPHSIPTHQTIAYQTVYPCDTACNSHPTFRSTCLPSCSQAFLLSSLTRPRGIHPRHRKPPLRQALYLDSPPSSASLVHHIPSATLDTHQHSLPCNLQPGLHVNININISFTSQRPFQTAGPYSDLHRIVEIACKRAIQTHILATAAATILQTHNEQRKNTRNDSVTIISAT